MKTITLNAILFTAAIIIQRQPCSAQYITEESGPDALANYFGLDIPQTCIQVGDLERCFYTYVPECANGAVPIVVDHHGFGSCPLLAAFVNEWIQKAHQECFIMLYPAAISSDITGYDDACFNVPGGINAPPATGNEETPGCCCFQGGIPIGIFGDNKNNNADLEFVRPMFETVINLVLDQTNGRVRVDTKRIYLAGHSNGCVYSMGILAQHSDLIAAVACTSGSMVTAINQEQYWATPVWMLRGELDTLIPVDGLFTLGTLVLPTDEYVEQKLASLNGCTATRNTTIPVPSMNLGDVLGQMTLVEHINCTDDADVTYVVINTGGHQVLNNFPRGETHPSGGLAANSTVDSTSMMWDFMSRHVKAITPDLGGNTTTTTTTSPENVPTVAPPMSSRPSNYPIIVAAVPSSKPMMLQHQPSVSPTFVDSPTSESPTNIVGKKMMMGMGKMMSMSGKRILTE